MTTGATYRWTIAFILFLALMSGIFTLDALPPLFIDIQNDIGLNNTQRGGVMSAFHLASPFFTPIGGLLADRYGPRRVLTIAAVILGVAGGMRFFADSALTLTFAMFCAGVGFASFGPSVTKALGTIFPQEHLARASGFVFSAVGFGNMIAFGTAAAVFSPMLGGWRPVMLLVGAYTLAVAALWYFTYRQPAANAHSSPDTAQAVTVNSIFRELREIAVVRDLWRLAIFYSLPAAAYMGALSHLPPILGERGVENPGFYFMLMTGFGAIANFAGGAISDRLGRRKIVLLTCCLGLAAMIPLMVSLSEGPALIAVMILAGVFFGPIIPISVIIPVELPDVGPAKAGAALGFMFMIGNIGAIVSPLIIGVLLDATGSIGAAMAFPVACLLLTALPLRSLTETGRRKADAAAPPVTV